MTEELERARLQSQSQGPTEGSETGSAAESSSIDQYEIMSKVLGERSDFQRGVGYSKGKGKKSASSSTSQSQAQPAHTPQEDMATMAEMMKSMREEIRMLKSQQGPSGNPQHTSTETESRFESLLQRYLPSQPEGGISSQSPPPWSMPQQQQQHVYPPQQNYPNTYGRSSQSPPLYYPDVATGSQTSHPRRRDFGDSSQQQHPQQMYGQFVSPSQQQRYGQFESFLHQSPSPRPHARQFRPSSQHHSTQAPQFASPPLLRPNTSDQDIDLNEYFTPSWPDQNNNN
ncbi:vacuolar protein sorting-associated protein 27-like [Humulus lupulus]|uniref:vacuolar protein sorting-associated protein 27-like n=1 Tax=Humulus lupulus TaxID=3486 RepID=UPI002B400C36|nr:vacuolar protein sorting-associated protein 27-like [Humulus lupulus]XP_062100088.1 vacuolar protein sorting-associated protein 27-like [Humulus lupulus]XP_062113209.1 vacuolar protein sorting-associated protein 27-like [Humulus lupulus]